MSAPSTHADARRVLAAWSAPDEGQDELRRDWIAYLDARPDALARSAGPAHLTASTLLLDAAGTRTLLTLHPKVGRWVQLGGHVEPTDATLSAAAGREALEESGIEGIYLDPVPVHLDRHRVRCGPGLEVDHLDVQFVATAPQHAQAIRSAESRDLAWFALEALPPDADDALRTLARRAADRVRS